MNHDTNDHYLDWRQLTDSYSDLFDATMHWKICRLSNDIESWHIDHLMEIPNLGSTIRSYCEITEQALYRQWPGNYCVLAGVHRESQDGSYRFYLMPEFYNEQERLIWLLSA